MADQIQILRGTRDEIVTATTQLLEGQPLYNETDKYLTIGGAENKSPSQLPIKVREVGGYFADTTRIVATSTSATSYHIAPKIDDEDEEKLEIYSAEQIAIRSERGTELYGSLVNISSANYGKLNISGPGFEVRTTGTSVGGTVIKIGTNTGSAGNTVVIGNTKATGSTSVYNISTDTSFNTDQIYTAPSGTPKMDEYGTTGTTYAENSAEKKLAPIIYNIGQRLDSLGFKEGALQSPTITENIEIFKQAYKSYLEFNAAGTEAYIVLSYQYKVNLINPSVTVEGISNVEATVKDNGIGSVFVTIKKTDGTKIEDMSSDQLFFIRVNATIYHIYANLKKEGNFVFVRIVDAIPQSWSVGKSWRTPILPTWGQKAITSPGTGDKIAAALLRVVIKDASDNLLFEENLDYMDDHTLKYYINGTASANRVSNVTQRCSYDLRAVNDAII